MSRRPTAVSLLPLFLCLYSACAADGGGPASSDTAALATPDSAGSMNEVKQVATTDTDTAAADASRVALCDKLQGRINACGHTGTFPEFTDWCLDTSRGDNAALTTCSIRPCALMVTCLDDAGAPSIGL